MSATKHNHAVVRNVYDLKEGMEVTLTDLQISASRADQSVTLVDLEIIQDDRKFFEYKLQPGAWRVTPESGLQKLEIQSEQYVETETSRTLFRHFEVFFSRLEVYEKYGLTPTRKILIGSDPGMGKSACIRAFCRKIRDEDGVCIVKVDSSQVSWETLTHMFMQHQGDEVKKVVLVVEDLGGTGLEERVQQLDSTMLNFLSGNSDIFKVPTLVIGTTNYLNHLSQTLINRPDRFDVVMELDSLPDADVVGIVQHTLKRELTAAEKKAVSGKSINPAYAIEALIRSEIYDLGIESAVEQVLVQRRKGEKRKHGVEESTFGLR